MHEELDRSRARRAVVMGGLLAGLAWGCGGDNLFAPSVLSLTGGPDVELEVSGAVGRQVFGGDVIGIRVQAQHEEGVEAVEVRLTGAAEVTLRDSLLVDQDPTSVDLTFEYTIPTGVNDRLLIRAFAWDSAGVFGEAAPIELTVREQRGVDPALLQTWVEVDPFGSAQDPNRVEVNDSIRISVASRDRAGGLGIRRVGYTIRMVRRNDPADTLWLSDHVETAAGLPGTVTRVFDLTALEDFKRADGSPFYDPVNRPDTLDLEFFGWGQDAGEEPICAAATSPGVAQQMPCAVRSVGGQSFVVAAGEVGHRVTLAVVSGETVRLPAGGSIADAVVHDDRRWLILSNMGLNRLEVFDLEGRTFLGQISVGSQPWGMTFDRSTQSTLYVANSGGTNISRVDLTAGAVGMEDHRIRTPNAILWEVSVEAGVYNRTFFDFSDRPQFLAQDADGWFVFSTRPTGTASDGTIRLGEFSPGTLGPDMAVRLVTDHSILDHVSPGETTWAIAQVDFMRTENIPGIAAETHVPGDMTDGRLSGTHVDPTDAVNDLRAQLAGLAHERFLPEVSMGGWDVGAIGLSDTTFIAHSLDRSAVVVGEGAAAPTGRVFYWEAATKQFTRVTTVADLTGNASERVLGVASNGDGRLNVGRGLVATYFFDPQLRLEGEVRIQPGGGGVALHPLHSGGPLMAAPSVSLAFVPVGGGVIEIHDTRHFGLLGRAYVRDTMLGPVRATLPFPQDNAGLNCVMAGGAVDVFHPDTEDSCVAVKLSGPTEGGGVVVVDITKADVRREG